MILNTSWMDVNAARMQCAHGWSLSNLGRAGLSTLPAAATRPIRQTRVSSDSKMLQACLNPMVVFKLIFVHSKSNVHYCGLFSLHLSYFAFLGFFTFATHRRVKGDHLISLCKIPSLVSLTLS